jgi:hypothetical protein
MSPFGILMNKVIQAEKSWSFFYKEPISFVISLLLAISGYYLLSKSIEVLEEFKNGKYHN